jgi:flagellar biosynthesis/type III secretory pathway protein FliH
VWNLPDLTAPARAAVPSAAGLKGEELEEAYRRGRETGLEEGAARTEVKVRGALEALFHLTQSLSASREQRLRDLEANIYAIALAAARKIVLREVTDDPTLVGNLVRRALGQMGSDNPIEVRAHPEDLRIIQEHLESNPAGPTQEIRWTADPSLQRGSFFLEGPHRIIDGRADEALRMLYERLDSE